MKQPLTLHTMILFVNGIEMDATKELEIFNDKLGFNAVIINKDNSVETRSNCTEIHHLYSNPFEPSIAFESDVHGTGGTRKVEDIRYVIVSDAIVKAERY